MSPFLGPTDPIQDIIKPDVVSPLIDPVFERLKPSYRPNNKPQTGNSEIKDFD